MKLLMFVLCLVLGACTSQNATGSVLPQTLADKPATSQTQYIYATVDNSLVVYPTGQPNPAPIRTVPLQSTGLGVITDHEGNVYVALPNLGEVVVYNSGATSLLRTISNLKVPLGLYVDSEERLLVGTVGCVQIIPDGDFAPTKTIFGPFPKFYVGGLAENEFGILFADYSDQGAASFIERYTKGTWTTDPPIQGAASLAGIAFNGANQLVVGASNYLATYAHVSGKKVWVQQSLLEFRGLVRMISRGQDGNIYAPVWDGGNPEFNSEIYIVTPEGAASTIDEGTSKIQGATEG